MIIYWSRKTEVKILMTWFELFIHAIFSEILNKYKSDKYKNYINNNEEKRLLFFLILPTLN